MPEYMFLFRLLQMCMLSFLFLKPKSEVVKKAYCANQKKKKKKLREETFFRRQRPRS